MSGSLLPAIPMPGTIDPMTEHEAAIKFAALLDVADEAHAPPESREPTPDAAPAAEAVPEDATATEQATEEESPSDESPEEETPAATPATPTTYRVKVDGEEREVPLEELLKGYSRTEDYTRKTQKLAEDRKAAEAELASVRAERAQYATTLGKLEEFLTSSTPQEPDWVALQRENPDQFPIEFAAWQVRKRQLDDVRAEKKAAEEKVLADRIAAMEQTMATEQARLLEAIPEWNDESKAKTEKVALVAFAKDQGFTAQELAGIYDHRVLVLLRKAMLHDKAAKTASQPAVRKTAPVLQPAAAQSAKPPVSDVTRARQRLAQTGDVKDAAEVFLRSGILD